MDKGLLIGVAPEVTRVALGFVRYQSSRLRQLTGILLSRVCQVTCETAYHKLP